jgi:hypothetical protein
MGPSEKRLRTQLRRAGIRKAAIDAAWPRWWTEAAEASASARNELRFALSRALGLDPRALVGGDRVAFAATVSARFKALTAAGAGEQDALASFGQSLARLLGAARPASPPARVAARRLRSFMLDHGIIPSFQSLVALCWSVGVPVVYPEVLPLDAKRMHAMAAGQEGRFAILIAVRDSLYAKAAFTVAHELGHIMLGHLGGAAAFLDQDDPFSGKTDEPEEDEANRFALELLTGRPSPIITSTTDTYNATELASAATLTGANEAIDPGTIALCDGFRTGDWARSIRACQLIQGEAADIAGEANGYALRQLDLDLLGEDGRSYLERVLGAGID